MALAPGANSTCHVLVKYSESRNCNVVDVVDRVLDVNLPRFRWELQRAWFVMFLMLLLKFRMYGRDAICREHGT